jgi:hypothetical protein
MMMGMVIGGGMEKVHSLAVEDLAGGLRGRVRDGLEDLALVEAEVLRGQHAAGGRQAETGVNAEEPEIKNISTVYG